MISAHDLEFLGQPDLLPTEIRLTRAGAVRSARVGDVELKSTRAKVEALSRVQVEIRRRVKNFLADPTMLPEGWGIFSHFNHWAAPNYQLPDCSWNPDLLLEQGEARAIREMLQNRVRSHIERIVTAFLAHPEELPDDLSFSHDSVSLAGFCIYRRSWDDLQPEAGVSWFQLWSEGTNRLHAARMAAIDRFLQDPSRRGSFVLVGENHTTHLALQLDTYPYPFKREYLHGLLAQGGFASQIRERLDLAVEELNRRLDYDRLWTRRGEELAKAASQWSQLDQLESVYGPHSELLKDELRALMDKLGCVGALLAAVDRPEAYADLSMNTCVQLGEIVLAANAMGAEAGIQPANRTFASDRLEQLLTAPVGNKPARLALVHRLAVLGESLVDETGVYLPIDLLLLPDKHPLVRAGEVVVALRG